jgi:Bacterial membrane protein YfhO
VEGGVDTAPRGARPSRGRTREPLRRRLATAPRRFSTDTWCLLAIAGAVVLANLLYLLGLFEANPLGPRSGLLSELITGPARGQPTIDPNNGFISQALGHRAALDWVHLELPWWNPYEGTGAPLAGEMQSAALFPLTALTLIPNGQLYEHMLLEILAGASTFLLLRRLSVSSWASTVAGVAFALNGTFAWLSHASVNPVAFLPLLLLGIELAYAASVAGRRGGWWLIAVAGALSFYAGFPEVAYIDALLAVAWLGWRCGGLGRQRLRALLGKAAAGALVGTLLSAPLLVAFLGFLDQAEVGQHEGGYYGSVHLAAEALPQLLLPYVYGPIFGFADPELVLTGTWGKLGGYLSTSLLLFGLFGLASTGRRGLRLLLAAWIVLALARIYGAPLLGDVLGVLPGMSEVAFYRYGWPSVELAVVVLAALGLDGLARVPGRRRRVALGASAALVVVAAAAIGARPLADRLGDVFSERPYYGGAVFWGGAVLLAAAVAALLLDTRARKWLLALIVAGDAILLFMVPQLSAPRDVEVDRAPVDFLQRNLGHQRFFTLGPLQPNYGSYFGVGSLNINDVPYASIFGDYVRRRLDRVVDPRVFVGNLGGDRSPFAASPRQELLRNLDGYRAAGVAYVLTPAGESLPQGASTFRLVFRSPSTWIYRLAGANRYFSTTTPGCDVRSDGRKSVELSCPGPTRLVRRETDLPGWSAEVDGDSVEVSRAAGLFQAVDVGAGSHRVEFSYRPPGIGWGFLGFAMGCCLLLIPVARARWRRIRSASA